MYTQKDGAWIKNVTEEARLIDAMRKGADLTIKGTSSRDTQSTDVYSLKGLSQAMDRVDAGVQVAPVARPRRGLCLTARRPIYRA